MTIFMEINSQDQYTIVDSSYLFALADSSDSTHKRATKIAKTLEEISKILVVPSEILFEATNTMWKKLTKEKATRTARDILTLATYAIPETTSEIRTLAFSKFEKQSRSVSFTDCLVMAFADHFKTKTILGFDESFSKSGYSLP